MPLAPIPECHEFQVAAIASGDLLEVVEGVGEEDDVSLEEVRALLATTQLGKVLQATLVHEVPEEVTLLLRVTPRQLRPCLLLKESILMLLDELADDPTLEEGTVEPADSCHAQAGVSDGKEAGDQGFSIEVLGVRVV